MLAILLIEMEWHKKERNPAGALVRREYYQPVPIAEGVELTGEGVFVTKCSYYQQGDTILSDQDALKRLQREFPQKKSARGKSEIGLEKKSEKRFENRTKNELEKKSDKSSKKESHRMPWPKLQAFTASDEGARRRAVRLKESIRKRQGAFYDIKKLDIPCVSFLEEPENSWRVRWYDDGRGAPRRRGGNEECYQPGAKLAGRVNTLNETAFILAPGEAGVLKYNYRFTSYDEQWYKCYYTYVVNAEKLTRDVFLREYDYEYGQMADLF